VNQAENHRDRTNKPGDHLDDFAARTLNCHFRISPGYPCDSYTQAERKDIWNGHSPLINNATIHPEAQATFEKCQLIGGKPRLILRFASFVIAPRTDVGATQREQRQIPANRAVAKCRGG